MNLVRGLFLAGLLAAVAVGGFADAYPAVAGIVDPDNHGWPREVDSSEGRVRLEAPPQRILALSLGHDEMLLALVERERLAGVGPFAADATYSNIADQVAGLDTLPSTDPEGILALRPDLVLVSRYTKADLVELIKETGIPVVRTALENSAAGNIPNILLLGYLLGVEERAQELVAEIEGRIAVVAERVPQRGDPAAPAVLAIARYSDTIYAAGGGSTEGGIVEAAGGVNAAARGGIDGHQAVSVESLAALAPDVILITQPAESGGTALRDELLAASALAEVPAVATGRVLVVPPRYYTTLSHWNVRGIEEAALLLFPDRFAGIVFADFAPQ
jgi:iron complex transport system substrate-binding protein